MKIGQIVAAFMAAGLAVFSAAPSALAWGSCARGPWVTAPPFISETEGEKGAKSPCECSGMPAPNTGGYVTMDSGGRVVVYKEHDPKGRTSGFVAIELEATDTEGNRVFVPAANYTAKDGKYSPIFCAIDDSVALGDVYPWPWQLDYTLTGRYRSVCLTNSTNFTWPDKNTPWAY